MEGISWMRRGGGGGGYILVYACLLCIHTVRLGVPRGECRRQQRRRGGYAIASVGSPCGVVGPVFFFVLNQLFDIPLHAARRAMASAARRSPSQARNSSLFPPQVYPFPTPEPACAVIVGVSQRLLLPMSARKHNHIQRKRVEQHRHPHT